MFGIGGGGPQLQWSGVQATDIDPQWSEHKVEQWKRWATKNIEGFDYSDGPDASIGPANDSQGIDYGMRPLLYDLNSRGYATMASNLASSGSDRIWLPFVQIRGRPPQGIHKALDYYAPHGYHALRDQDYYQRTGISNVGYSHESCSDPVSVNSCSHDPGPQERAQVDAAFIKAVRSVI